MKLQISWQWQTVFIGSHVLKDGHVIRNALDSEVEGQRKKERPKTTWKKQVEEERRRYDG